MTGQKKTDLLSLLKNVERLFTQESEDYDQEYFNETDLALERMACSASSGLEDIEIISGIVQRLESSAGGRDDKWESTDVDTVIGKVRSIILGATVFELKRKMVGFNIKKSRYFVENNRISNALHVWEDVLAVDPCNEDVHSELDRIIKGYEGDDA